jgi:nitrogen regulatory protein PII
MLQLVVLVLNDATQLEPLLEAWTNAGAQGITVLHSTGFARLRGGWRRDDAPLFPSLRDLLEYDDLHHRTLFTVVDDDALVDRLIAAAQRVVGDLDAENTGILFTVPVGRVLGLQRRS